MGNSAKKFAWKIFTYVILSYLVALISIGIIYVMSYKEGGTSGVQSVFNILFSTNACFISTTGWSIKKDRHPLDNGKDYGDPAYLATMGGSLLSMALLVLSAATDYFSYKVYSWGLVLTLIPCAYLAWIYTKETIQKETIIAEHDAREYMNKAREMMETKQEDSFNMSGTEYKV